MSAKTLFFTPLNPKIRVQRQKIDVLVPIHSSKGAGVFWMKRFNANFFCQSKACPQKRLGVCAVLAGIKDTEVSPSQFEDLSLTVDDNEKELKISIEVPGDQTRAIFNAVFSQMVTDAQPIPGFRRVKGGKTPDIPRDILLQVLGPTKVYKKVITKIINSTISDYVEKEGLAVTKDLRIEQSFEELEDVFEPDEPFRFDALLQLK